MEWTYKPERRASLEDIAEAIHDTITMEDVIRMYCPELIPKHHRIPCPIHSGKDPNFSFTRNGYKCFVCGASGDVIAFVKEVSELSTRADAMKQINRDFRLNLPIDRNVTHSENKALEERRKAAQERDRLRMEWETGLDALWAEWCRLDRQKRECRPGSDAWIEAALNIDRVAYEIDCYPPEAG